MTLRARYPPRGVVEDPLIDALVASTGEDQMSLAAEPALCGRLGERHAGGSGDHRAGRRPGQTSSRHGPHTVGLHDHAGAATVGRVVDRRWTSWVQRRRSWTSTEIDAPVDRLAQQGRSQAVSDIRERSRRHRCAGQSVSRVGSLRAVDRSHSGSSRPSGGRSTIAVGDRHGRDDGGRRTAPGSPGRPAGSCGSTAIRLRRNAIPR